MSTSSLSPNPDEDIRAKIVPKAEPRGKPVNRMRLLLVVVALGIGCFFGLRYLAESWANESTDDAFIDGHVAPIAAKIAGEVVESHVTENQAVKAGDLLVEVDPKMFEAKLNQKRAALESAEANQRAIKTGFDLMRARVNTAEATKKQTEAQAEASHSTYENAEANWIRAQNMWTNVEHQVISHQDFDAARAAMETAKANWHADLEKVASDTSKVTESEAQLDTAKRLYEEAGAQISQAQADLRMAELELSYTKIVAPVDGRVTRKMVEKGGYVQAGQNLLAIVRPEIWITANFKETQTAKIRPGQPVEIQVDGRTGAALHGHVDSLMAGSGARFSLLPPENAVGNYVKVVQRVPVKILFDDPVEAMGGLGPGMSVTPTVQVGNRLASDLVIVVVSIVFALVVGALVWVLMQRNSNKPSPA